MEIIWDKKVKSMFNDIKIAVGMIYGIKVSVSEYTVEDIKNEVIQYLKEKCTLQSLKDLPLIRAYRDFYWKIKIDPTKTRPSAEALIRRLLSGKNLPKISNIVDAYNLASAKSQISISAYDLDKILPPLKVRFANPGETFIGIGGKKVTLSGKELVLTDQNKVLSIYPHKDSELTKINNNTHNILIVAYGVPKISSENLINAVKLCYEYIGKVSETKKFNSIIVL